MKQVLGACERRHPVPGSLQELAVRRTLVHRLGHPFRLDLTSLDTMPRSAGGKYEDFPSLLG